MNSYFDLANSVKYKCGKMITLIEKSPQLEVIGVGRSAYVFKIASTNKVIKVFYPEFSHVAKIEAEVYNELIGSSYYGKLYDCGSNYLVIDYIEGQTLFNCLTKGVPITRNHIRQIDSALKVAKERGLNPSDIHLQNIIITSAGDVKIIDVARYKQIGACRQWSDIKAAYLKFYKYRLFPKRLPAFLLHLVAYLYKMGAFHYFLRSSAKMT